MVTVVGFVDFFGDFSFELSILECVPKRTVEVFELAFFAFVALSCFVHEYVVVTFLPAVAELAVVHEGTAALLVTLDAAVLVPVGTLHHPVVVIVAPVFSPVDHQVLPYYSAAVVLGVVRVHTVLSVVLRHHWAPHCFVRVEEETLVLGDFVQELDPELRLVVHEGTETLVGTLFQHVWVERTVLRFEPVVVVSLN